MLSVEDIVALILVLALLVGQSVRVGLLEGLRVGPLIGPGLLVGPGLLAGPGLMVGPDLEDLRLLGIESLRPQPLL